MVSIVIGSKGNQIKRITNATFTDIKLDQVPDKSNFRRTQIEGRVKDIASAASKIYQLMEEKASAYDILERDTKTKKMDASVRFAVQNDCGNYLLREHTLDRYKVDFQLLAEKNNKALKEGEIAVVILL